MNKLYYYKNVPFNDLVPSRESLFDAHELLFNKFYDDFFGNRKNFSTSTLTYPKMDIVETSDSLVIKCAVPGVLEEDLSLETNKETRVLTLKGQTSSSHVIADSKYVHLKELKSSAFTRTVKLPEYIDLENATASLKDGMLTLTFNLIKVLEPKPDDNIKRIAISK